jgi:hypothetical protein
MANPRFSMRSFHVGVAAEAFAAGLFAQAGFDVSVQYGANQPDYDLLVSRDDRFLKISVKGSQDGGWGLIHSHKKGRSYHEAIDFWASKQSRSIVYCFVQFMGVKLGECPRVYLATVTEVANSLKASRLGAGNTTLLEYWSFKKGVAAGTEERLPPTWAFSAARASELLQRDA